MRSTASDMFRAAGRVTAVRNLQPGTNMPRTPSDIIKRNVDRLYIASKRQLNNIEASCGLSDLMLPNKPRTPPL